MHLDIFVLRTASIKTSSSVNATLLTSSCFRVDRQSQYLIQISFYRSLLRRLKILIPAYAGCLFSTIQLSQRCRHIGMHGGCFFVELRRIQISRTDRGPLKEDLPCHYLGGWRHYFYIKNLVQRNLVPSLGISQYTC